MQFESQLSQYEKYASLAQLGLGAAHEINNPLLGILSHLELEWKDVGEERRQEIEQCIEGAKRISAAVGGLLDYAYPGRLKLSKINQQSGLHVSIERLWQVLRQMGLRLKRSHPTPTNATPKRISSNNKPSRKRSAGSTCRA